MFVIKTCETSISRMNVLGSNAIVHGMDASHASMAAMNLFFLILMLQAQDCENGRISEADFFFIL